MKRIILLIISLIFIGSIFGCFSEKNNSRDMEAMLEEYIEFAGSKESRKADSIKSGIYLNYQGEMYFYSISLLSDIVGHNEKIFDFIEKVNSSDIQNSFIVYSEKAVIFENYNGVEDFNNSEKSKNYSAYFEEEDIVFDVETMSYRDLYGNLVENEMQEFYIDPVNGSMENDGSYEKPWKTLKEVIDYDLIESYRYDVGSDGYNTGDKLVIMNEGAPIRGGAVLYLRNGYHGEIEINRFENNKPITVKAQDGHEPKLARLVISAASNWKFEDINISPSYADETIDIIENPDWNIKKTIVDIQGNWHGKTSDIIIENCNIFSVEDILGWDIDDWNNLSYHGLKTRNATNIKISNNTIRNIDFGVSIASDFNEVKDNIIENFGGDGMRLIGNDLLAEGNTIMNCYKINDNHDDGIQSWCDFSNNNAPRERVIIRKNLIINYTDENQPLKGSLQGIGLFDGPYKEWIIENNIIIVDHWHAISMYGGIDCKIINNTVADIWDENGSAGPGWIRLADMKNGSHSENCIVRNNIAHSFTIGEGVSADHNYQLSELEATFADYINLDLSLVAGAEAIDSGSSDAAPQEDYFGNIRDNIPDIGAVEY